MKILYVILIGLLMFNFTLLWTDAIGLFPGTNYQGQEITTTLDGDSFTNLSGIGLLNMAVGGLNPAAAVTSGLIFAGAIAAAWAFKSPVTLGIGGFASIFTGLWIQTYGVLNQFTIPNILLLAGTAGVGVLFLINVIEASTGGHYG